VTKAVAAASSVREEGESIARVLDKSSGDGRTADGEVIEPASDSVSMGTARRPKAHRDTLLQETDGHNDGVVEAIEGADYVPMIVRGSA
jgi:hypothetical protein